MADGVVVIESASDSVIPLHAQLEAPDVDVVVGDTEVIADAAVVVETKIEEAVESGASKEEINELRGMLRDLRSSNINLQTRLAAAERVQKGDLGTDGANVELSELEQYQEVLDKVSTRDFTDLLAVMEVNPKFEDYKSVCSARHFADIFDSVASHRSSQNGTDFNTELVRAQAEIWSMPNPYKYMYETIKEFHPDYASKEPAGKTETPAKTAKEVLEGVKPKTVVTAPGSVAELGGGDNTQGGWTAARIDALPETQLHTVPREIYKKWLSNELS